MLSNTVGFEHRSPTAEDEIEVPLRPAYKGEWRVDNHPRLSRDERTVCIDSPHAGEGRQLHLINISGIA